MSVQQIQTQSGPDVGPYVQRVPLDGLPYRLAFRWNDRSSVWVLSIADDAGTAVCGPLAIRNGFPLLMQHHATDGVPPGELYAWAKTEPERDAGHEELGSRVVLFYIEAE